MRSHGTVAVANVAPFVIVPTVVPDAHHATAPLPAGAGYHGKVDVPAVTWWVVPSARVTVAVVLGGMVSVSPRSGPLAVSAVHSIDTVPRLVGSVPLIVVRPTPAAPPGAAIVSSAAPGAVMVTPSSACCMVTATVAPQPWDMLSPSLSEGSQVSQVLVPPDARIWPILVGCRW